MTHVFKIPDLSNFFVHDRNLIAIVNKFNKNNILNISTVSVLPLIRRYSVLPPSRHSRSVCHGL